MSQPTRTPDPHDHAQARRAAEHLRRDAVNDFWRGSDALLAHVCLDAGASLSRSTQRLQARLRQHRQARAQA